MAKPLLRRLGDVTVVFDPATWQTHVLPPDMAGLADSIAALSGDAPVSMASLAEYVHRELALDPETPEIRALLLRLAEIGVLEG